MLVYESYIALLHASFMSLVATAWPTSACWMPQAPRELFLSTASLTYLLYLFVSGLNRHLCVHMWYIVRLAVIFSHFTRLAPLSVGNISTAEANLASVHVLEVGSVPFSFYRKLKWAIIIRAIQVSDAPSNLPCSHQVLPSQGMHLEIPQILAFLNPFSLATFNLV